MKRWLLWIAGALFALVILIVALGLYGKHLWQTEPDYWTLALAYTTSGDPAELTDTADRAFNRVLSELSNSSGYQPLTEGAAVIGDKVLGVRTIRLSYEEANAWLATRLNDWLINRKRELPPGVSHPILSGEDGSLIAAFHYTNTAHEIDQVFSVLLSMRLLSSGQATLHVDGVRGGRLPLPKQAVLDQLRQLAGEGENQSKIIGVLLGQTPFDPVLPIDGTRRGRIIEMHADSLGVELIVQAEETD